MDLWNDTLQNFRSVCQLCVFWLSTVCSLFFQLSSLWFRIMLCPIAHQGCVYCFSVCETLTAVHHVRFCSSTSAGFKWAKVGRCWQERKEPTYSSRSSMQVWQLKLNIDKNSEWWSKIWTTVVHWLQRKTNHGLGIGLRSEIADKHNNK